MAELILVSVGANGTKSVATIPLTSNANECDIHRLTGERIPQRAERLAMAANEIAYRIEVITRNSLRDERELAAIRLARLVRSWVRNEGDSGNLA